MLWAEYLCGNLADGGELGVLMRRVSRHAARYTARVAALFSAASPNQVFYNTKVDGEDNGPQRDGALVIKINA